MAAFSVKSLAVTVMVGASSLTRVITGVSLPVPLRPPLSVTVSAIAGKALPAFTKAAPVAVSTTWPPTKA